jgi:stage III sporulation protein AG
MAETEKKGVAEAAKKPGFFARMMGGEKKKPDNGEKKEGFFAKIKKVKHIEIIIALVAVGIMLLIYFFGFGGDSTSKKTTTPSDNTVTTEYYSDYCKRMQSELTRLVSSMEGAGAAQVLINWESSVELILAKNENMGTNSSTSSPVIVGGSSSSPIITKEIYPKALGVVVICQGGADPRIKLNVIMSVSTLLSLEPDDILVYAMKK